MKEDQESIWLVKSATRVLGPFSKKQIADLLRNKQINIIDEIKSPTTRWTFIRENIYFLEIVKMIRHEQDTHQDNTVNSRTVTLMTRTNEVAEDTTTDTDVMIDEDTGKIDRNTGKIDRSTSKIDQDTGKIELNSEEDLSFKNVEVTAGSSVDQKIQELEPISETRDVKKREVRSSNKTYGTVLDKGFRQQTQRSFSGVYIVIGLAIFAIIVSFVGYKKYLDYQKTALIATNVQRIKSLKAAGLYTKAFEGYKALPAEYTDGELDTLMLPLALQMDRQSAAVRSKVNSILDVKTPVPLAVQIESHLVLALSHMMDSNFSKARDEFDLIKGLDSSNNYVRALRSVVYFKEHEITKARNEGLSLEVFPSWAFNLYLKLLILVDTPKEAITSDINTKIDILIHEVEEYINQGHGFLSFELNLLSYILARKMGNHRMMQFAFNNLFDSPLRESEKYAKDPLLDWSLHSWDFLNTYCNQAFGEEEADYRIRLGRAICAFQQGRDTNALAILNQVQTAQGLKPEILNIRGMILLQQKNYAEARNLASMKEWQGTDTEKYVSVASCMAMRENNCSLQKLDGLIAKPNFKIPAMQLKLQNARANNNKDVPVLIKSILELEPNYVPTLEVRDTIEAQR